MPSIIYKLTEFLCLFVLVPVSFAFAYPIWIKMVVGVLGFAYVLWVLLKQEKINFRIKKEIAWKNFAVRTTITFIIIALLTTVYVYLMAPEKLFFVPLNNFKLYIIILLVYSILSVWPQEIIYRTFFVKRYASLFKSESLLIFVNAVLFSLAHIFFKNTLVLILTFIGGLIFAYSYLKFKSTTLVTIEHALYGNWLFTVGMGEMLAFPGMETP